MPSYLQFERVSGNFRKLKKKIKIKILSLQQDQLQDLCKTAPTTRPRTRPRTRPTTRPIDEAVRNKSSWDSFFMADNSTRIKSLHFPGKDGALPSWKVPGFLASFHANGRLFHK